MPIYSEKFFSNLIEPTWRLIIFELSIYTDNIIFNKPINYSQDENLTIYEENHDYSRGYESEDEDEKYGLEGLILELFEFTIDLIKRDGVKENLKEMLITFLLSVKGYCLLPYNSINLWKNDPNLYIIEEFGDENENSIRNKSLNLIKEITSELENDMLLKFFRIIILEFNNGIEISNYSGIIKLEDCNFIHKYLNKMNTEQDWIFRRHEANLLILGNLANDLLNLKELGKLDNDQIREIMQFLFTIITNSKNETNSNYILTGRVIWCVGRLLILVDQQDFTKEIFEGVSLAFTNRNSDLSISLIACKCLGKICEKIFSENSGNFFDSENLILNYTKLIELLKLTSDETIIIPIQTILSISKLNMQKPIFIANDFTKLIIEIYSKFYNHPVIGNKILELLKLWCEDSHAVKILMNSIIPFAFHVFEDFFKSIGNQKKVFEEIRNRIIIEYGDEQEYKTSLDILPVNFFFMSIK